MLLSLRKKKSSKHIRRRLLLICLIQMKDVNKDVAYQLPVKHLENNGGSTQHIVCSALLIRFRVGSLLIYSHGQQTLRFLFCTYIVFFIANINNTIVQIRRCTSSQQQGYNAEGTFLSSRHQVTLFHFQVTLSALTNKTL